MTENAPVVQIESVGYPSKPDLKELKNSIAAERVKLEFCFARLKESRGYYLKCQSIRNASKPALYDSRKKQKQLSQDIYALLKKNKDLTGRIKTLRPLNKNLSSDTTPPGIDPSPLTKLQKQALGSVRNTDELQARTALLRNWMESNHPSLAEEKKVVRQIEFLETRAPSILLNFENTCKVAFAQNQGQGKDIRNIEVVRLKNNRLIASIRAAQKEGRGVVDKIFKQIETDIAAIQNDASAINIQKEKAQVDECKKRIENLKQDFNTRNDRWRRYHTEWSQGQKKLQIKTQRRGREKFEVHRNAMHAN